LLQFKTFINVKLLLLTMTINTEYLAISVIFFGGIYFGIKIKQGLYNLEQYFTARRNP